MDEKIIAMYCLCDALFKARPQRRDPLGQMSEAEVMTTALTAAVFLWGTLERARLMLQQHGSILQMLSKRHFRRRLYSLKETLMLLFNV